MRFFVFREKTFQTLLKLKKGMKINKEVLMSKFLVSMILLVSSLFGAVTLTNTGNTVHFYFKGYEGGLNNPKTSYYYDADGVKRDVVLDTTISTTVGKYISYVPSVATLKSNYNNITLDTHVTIVRGSVIYYLVGTVSRAGGYRMIRSFIYNVPSNQNFTYKTFSMQNFSEITKTVSYVTSSWMTLNDVCNNTLIQRPNVLSDSIRATNDGDCMLWNKRGKYMKVSSKYVHIKNSTSAAQTVTYTEVFLDSISLSPVLAPRSKTRIIPKDSTIELIGLTATSTVSIGSVSTTCSLGDRIVISDDIAVEKMSTSKMTNALTVYPNPSNGTLNVRLNSKSDIRIFTLDGKLIQSYKNVNSIKADALLNGVYVVSVSAKQGGVELKKMITVAR